MDRRARAASAPMQTSPPRRRMPAAHTCALPSMDPLASRPPPQRPGGQRRRWGTVSTQGGDGAVDGAAAYGAADTREGADEDWNVHLLVVGG
jgi:hypothetical protein